MLVFAALAATIAAGSGSASGHDRSSTTGRVTVPEIVSAIAARSAVPAFSRQTKLACSICHNGYPQLTPIGRQFKLNGYTMTGLAPIVVQKDSTSRMTLDLSPIAPLSVMALISSTHVATAVPGAQATTTQFPQQISLFAASGISDKMGIFSQFTYEDQSGTFGIDNVNIRFANTTKVAGHDLLFGLTLNNNPSVQDVWNTTPAWSYPFNSASVAPSPAAATLIEGALAQSVLGLGAYSLLSNTLYAELSGYVSAPQGAALPLDSTASNTVHSISPYWRVALQHQFGTNYLMVGTFGLHSELFPTGITGETNHYTDIGFDAQVEHTLEKGVLIGRASYIHERQVLTAAFTASPAASQNSANNLSSQKVNISWLPDATHALTLGYFGSSGTSDNVLYQSSPVNGSSTGSPGSHGVTIEGSVNPWLNVRLGAQYVMYQKFNGASNSYDVSPGGRNAKDNNTLYLYLWFAY